MSANQADAELGALDLAAHRQGAGVELHERHAQLLEAAGRVAEAAEALDRALAIDAARPSALDARARLSLALGAEDTVEHCRRALALRGADPELQLQMIGAAASMIGIAALPLFEDYLSSYPADLSALEQVAELRAQAGYAEPFEGFEPALAIGPDREELYLGYARSLRRGRDYAAAFEVVARARRIFGETPASALMEAELALDSGDPRRAEHALHSGRELPGTAPVRAQLLLQAGLTTEAAALLERLVASNPGDASLWAMLSIAWRLTRDPRHEWLCQPGLWRMLPLALSEGEREEIAAALARIHTAKAAPLGQSVRGGTQTPGWLFARTEPEIVRLSQIVAEGVRDYLGGLPPFDAEHPLLRHKDRRLAFGPSWSVRLTAGGFHVPHVHPGGVLSSALYLSVPPPTPNGPDKAGWLELGRPPAQLRLDLDPLAILQPCAGSLALFPSYLFHGTRPFPAGERLSVAFDVVAG